MLIDLEWKPEAGGQVLCWQNLAAAARGAEDLHLTLHAEGETEEKKPLHDRATLWLHPPVFSTRNVPFLHTPAHTDLGFYHAGLARALAGADIIHTTDAFFCYAKTAEKLAKKKNLPLMHSVHTDTVSYSRIFTRVFLEKCLDGVGVKLDEVFGFSKNVEKDMAAKLLRHERLCRFVLASRAEDVEEARRLLGPVTARSYRLGIDGVLFHPDKRDHAAFCKRYGIPEGATIVVFAGRLDDGKNVMRLVSAMEWALKHNAPLFLFVAGLGPKAEEIKARLGNRVALAGFLPAGELARAYASADYLALPSTVETWSLVAAEALACGLPVIASSSSGVGRFLGGEGAGLLVDENSDAAWEKALMEACVLQDRARLREAARRAALSQFPSWEQALLQDFLPVWREAAKRSE